MGRKLLLLLLLIPTFALSQKIVPRKQFSKAIEKNVRQFKRESKLAYASKDYERAQFLFDSLVDNVINGTYLDNFDVRKSSGKKIKLYDIEKPVFLITYASWCVPGVGEVPALNSIAENYHDKVEIVVLFWGTRKKTRKVKRNYSKRITVLYVDETENTNDFAIRTMKHSLGFPTAFYMDIDKKILDVRRTVNHHYSEDFTTAFNDHYQTFMSGLSLILNLKDDQIDQSFLSKN